MRSEKVWRKPDPERKSRAGRKPIDAVLLLKTLVLSAFYYLPDDQIEYQVCDRLSFMRLLGHGIEGRVPDAKTVWLCREALAQAGMMEALFKQFDGQLARQGHITREENKASKSSEVPEDWADRRVEFVA